MRNRALWMLCACLAGLSFLAGIACAEGFGTAVIDAGDATKLHLRAQPLKESQSYGLYFTGTQVTCLSDPSAGEWTRVMVGTQDGYMGTEYLKTGASAEQVVSAQPVGVVGAKQGIDLRSGPSEGDTALEHVASGERMLLLGETSGHWYLARYGTREGYVKAEFVSMQAPENGDLTGYERILRGEEPFVNAADGSALTMHALNRCFGLTEELTAVRYASIDLDADGEEEVVVCVTSGGYDFGSLVLDQADGQVYGHAFFIREMLDLKADGTFSFSSGAMDSGMGYLRLDGANAQVVEIASSRSQADGSVGYYAGGQAVTEAVFRQIDQEQMRKAGPVWQDCP